MEVNTRPILDNSELRLAARNQLKGNWGNAILLCLIFGIISVILGSMTGRIHWPLSMIGSVLTAVVMGPMMLGLITCFLKLIRNEPFRFENLFDGFQNFVTAMLLQILMTIFIALWSLLLVIPGIIATYRYSMAFYILSDNPELGAMDALRASRNMMIGHKWKLFCLHLSFLGWAILSILTCGIGFLWLTPYVNTTQAYFYQNLKEALSGREF